MADATLVLAIRHGQTGHNATQRIQGQLDIDLDDTGRWQATRLGDALRDAGLAAVHSSDLQRARHTADAIGRATGLPLQLHPGLRERGFGRLEGLSYAEIEARYPDDALRWRRREPGFGPGGGEPLDAFYARSVQAFAAIAAAHLGQTIAVVAHGGVLDCLYRAATGAELQAPRTWQLGNAAINRLLYSEGRFVVVGWDDRTHLEGPAGADAADA